MREWGSTLSSSSSAPCTLVAVVSSVSVTATHGSGLAHDVTLCRRFTNPHFTVSSSSQQEDCSECLILNEKWRERMSYSAPQPRWDEKRTHPEDLCSQYKCNYSEKEMLIVVDFLIMPSGHLVSVPTLYKYSQSTWRKEALTLSVAVMHCSFICFR